MDEVDELRQRVAALEAKVAALVTTLERGGILVPEPPPPPPLPPMMDAGSPYRGGRPGQQRLVEACTRCGRALEADDTELSLGAGRVCLGCYSRGI